MSPSSISASWTPNTTNQLSGGPLYYDILDHFLEAGHDEARLEVQESTLMSNLQPARTTGDAQLQAILELLGSNESQSEGIISRGDSNTFLTPEVRASERFQKLYPHFSAVLGTMEATVRSHISESSVLNLSSKVSVQLAVYPGDGKSGYPQHCDVSGACSADQEDFAVLDPDQVLQRLLTAVYYMTPPDWSSENDGGHLRLFVGGSAYDAAPLSNRCIMFRSDKVLHEVLPSKRRNRVAVTMWFYGRKLQHNLNLPPRIKVSLLLSSSIEGSSTSGPSPLAVQGDCDSISTIFVSIASFRDSETLPTIRALLETAQFPDRIAIGLVWQYDPEKDPPTLIAGHPQIRSLSLEAKDARGPCYARRLAQYLYRDEDYVLQIDSHMRFRRNWDVYLIEQLPAGKSILTTYPIGYTLPNLIPNEIRPTLMVPWKFDSSGMLRQRGRLLKKISRTGPIRTQLYAAGFNFARRESMHDCPYLTHQVFFGEEVYRAVQFHQQNYQLWAPPEAVVYHLWSRDHRPSFSLPTKGSDKLALLKYLDHQVPEDIWIAMGVDWKNKELFEGASLGGFPSEASFAGWADESLEHKVANLNPNAQEIIRSFLSQLNGKPLPNQTAVAISPKR